MHPHYRGWLLPLYFSLIYLLLLAINHATVDFSGAGLGWGGRLFALNVFLTYNLIYLLPSLLLTWLAGRPRFWHRWGGERRAFIAEAWVAILSGALTTLFFYANARLYELYGMFVNGFVINLVVTPGGIESLGGSAATNASFALLGAGFLLGHVALLLGLRALLVRQRIHHGPSRRLAKAILWLFVAATLTDQLTYAYADAYGKSELMSLSQGVPYYTGLTMRKTLRKLGFKPIMQQKVMAFKGKLNYPLQPLQVTPPQKPYNIVWLVSESWRADTLNPEIMPQSWEFAGQSQNYKLHYSAGNGTRIGVFGMMTGVPGNYWEHFLQSHRSSPIIDVLQQQNYQMALYTSARFSYPEFDRTIFSKVPKAQLHEIDASMQGWEKDRKNVGDLLDFIDKRDPARPFFTWMFFESPHARYYFPPESVIRKPYRDDINYATLDRAELKDNMTLIHNRYLNAVHHLDSQFGRVIAHLKQNNLLDSTIVILVGDHGEEFMEHGFWGHNSTFADAQTRTPLVLWVPGMAPKTYDKLTSHLDIPATLMPRLGVNNPASDYSTGIDLLSDRVREYVVMSDWSHIAYRDQQVKITLPMSVQGGFGRKVAGPDDEYLDADNARSLSQAEQPHLAAMLRDIGRFVK